MGNVSLKSFYKPVVGDPILFINLYRNTNSDSLGYSAYSHYQNVLTKFDISTENFVNNSY